MKQLTMLVLCTTIVGVAACSNTADGVKRDAERVADKSSEVASDAGAALDAAGETANVKLALIADSTVDASDINVNTNKDLKTVTLNGVVPNAAQVARAEAIAKAQAPGYTVVNRLTVR
jgi:hyperosmotically inducible protein